MEALYIAIENHRKTTGKWWFNGGLMGFNGIFDGIYPLVMTNIAMKTDH